MNRSAYLIFNPIAGGGNPETDLEEICSFLEPEFELTIHQTTEEIDGSELAQEAIAQGVECIIASGGDGTVSGVAKALINTEIPLGVIPRGTANAFAAALGIPTTIEGACQVIIGGATAVVDTALCNDQAMLLLAGVGFEAQAVEETDREKKKRWGMLAYVLSGIGELQNIETFATTLETEEQIISVTAVAVTVANAAPPTSILAQGTDGIFVDDGLLDITIVATVNAMSAIASAYHLLQTAMSEQASQRDDIGYFRAKWVKISTEPPQKVVLDGEMIGTTPIKIECVPKSLTIFVPTDHDSSSAEVAKLEGLPDLKVELK